MTTIAGIRIAPTDAEGITAVELENADLLESLRESVGCGLIETIQLTEHIDAILDEEGKLTGAQPNEVATAAARILGHSFLPGDYIAGTVVFLGYTDDGEHVGLTDEQRRAILRAVVLATA